MPWSAQQQQQQKKDKGLRTQIKQKIELTQKHEERCPTIHSHYFAAMMAHSINDEHSKK